MESEPQQSDVPESSEIEATPVANGIKESEIAIPPEKLTEMALALEIALVVVALLLAWLANFSDASRPISDWLSGNWVGEIAIGLVLALPFLFVVLVLLPKWKLLEPFFELVDEKITPIFKSLNIWQVGLISLSAGVGEEFLFRWCLQGGLTEQFGLPIALILASVVFGLVHYLNFTYFALVTVLGSLLGLIYWYFGPLAAIACHAAYDFFAILHLQKTSD